MHNFQEILGFQQRANKINVLLWIYDDKIIVYKYEFLPYTKNSFSECFMMHISEIISLKNRTAS